MTPIAHKVDETRKMILVRSVGVRASPARVGMNAFIEGINFPTKIYHIPFFENVTESAEYIFVNVFSSVIKSFCAKRAPYFFTNINMAMLPTVLPRAPAITVGIKRRFPVLTKYPHTT